MSIRNSLKLLFGRFELVWQILLYLVILLVVVFALGAIFIQPIIQAAVDLNLDEAILKFYDVLLKGNLENIFGELKALLKLVKNIFVGDRGIIFKTFIMPVLFFITFNLLAGLYELPLCKVLEARMSSNAKIPLMGNLISLSGKSVLYVLVKLLFIIVSDFIILLFLIGSYKLLLLSNMPLLIPFVVLLILLLLVSFKKCFTVTWNAEIIIGGNRIFASFGRSVKSGFKDFKRIFPCYFVSMLLLFVMNGLMALLTFGVGLVVSVPVSMLYLKFLEMTEYYSLHEKRYYLDANTIVGQDPNEKAD